MSGAALLEVNTKFANATDFQPAGSAACAGSDLSQKTHLGLVRVRYAPRGVDVEKFEKDDQAVYRRFLRWKRLRSIQHLLHDQRVCKCYRVRVLPKVRVHYVSKIRRAHYGGLVICGGVWVCPVCSAKITERRRIELEGANDKRFSKFMVTYTLQHGRQYDRNKLQRLIGDLRAGLRDMKNSRSYKQMIKDLRIVGSVTALEVTISNVNGWHPHIHALMYSELPQSKIKAAAVRDRLSSMFIDAMKKRGRYVHDAIGVNVRSGKDVKREYLAKFGSDDRPGTWSLAAEITKSPVKTGRDDDNFHPFDLVDMYQGGNMNAGYKFIEYTVAMKHKKQLVYTRGLRDLLGLDVELSDQEVAEMQDQSAIVLAELSDQDWNVIIQHEKRGELLEVASTGNYNKLVTWMRAIGCANFGRMDQ